jgi:sensor histidine kinase YesM
MKKTLIVFLHLLYWLMFLLLLTTMYGFMSMNPAFEAFTQRTSHGFSFWIKLMIGFSIIPALISFYVSYWVLAPALVYQRKFLRFALVSLGSSLLASIIGALLESMPFLFGRNFLFNDGLSSAISIIGIMTLVTWIHGIIGAIISGFVRWFDERKKKEDIEKKQVETELELLRARLNPHFLFNTLNNIDVMLEKDPMRASNYLGMLSDILRYTLYESGDAQISAMRELTLIEKYIQLQRIRSPFPESIQLSISGDFSQRSLPPMIFAPFIENAFKYASQYHSGPIIHIRFEFRDKEIYFCCINQTDSDISRKEEIGGMGLDLARKRLLMTYPDRHHLLTKKEGNQYIVELTIHEEAALHHR